MATLKLIVLLCSAILTCYCQETATKRPTGNSTSRVEKEGGLKPIAEKPVVQKMANQIVKPEHPSNVNPESQHQPINQRNPGQDARQARRSNSQDPNQPSVRYQGQQPSTSDPSTYRRSLVDRSQPQPAHPRNPSTDARQTRRLDQDRNQPSYQDESPDSQNRDLSRVPYYSRPATSEDQGHERRRQYRDPSIVSQDEQTFKPYSFNYIAESEEGTTSHQQAADTNGRVSGSYSMALGDGRKRIVEYIADENGFRANVDTNEPGTSSAENPASVVYSSSGPTLSAHEFRGNTNRLQPQPNQLRPGRDGYRTETRMTNSISGPFRGTYDRTGSQPIRGQTQFRSGRDNVAENDATNDNGSQQDQNQVWGVPRSSRDNSQGAPDGRANRIPYGVPSPAFRSDRGYPNRPSAVSPEDSQAPNLSSFGRDNRQGNSYQPTGNRSPLNTVPQLGGQNNARGLDGTNRPFQSNPSQPDEFTSSVRNNAANEPSYHGWFRPSFRPREETLRPGYRSQQDSFTPDAQPEEGDVSGYQPVIRVENPRSLRQPTWASSRPNPEDPPQSQAGGSPPRSLNDPESRNWPQYNRNNQVQPDSRVSNPRPQSNVRINQSPMNIPQPDFRRANPSEGYSFSQSSHDNQRLDGRQEFIIPVAAAVTDGMPQGYRNYGTYWYSGN